jgi:hypothetical protein
VIDEAQPVGRAAGGIRLLANIEATAKLPPVVPAGQPEPPTA